MRLLDTFLGTDIYLCNLSLLIYLGMHCMKPQKTRVRYYATYGTTHGNSVVLLRPAVAPDEERVTGDTPIRGWPFTAAAIQTPIYLPDQAI